MNKNEFITECKNLGLDINDNILSKLNNYFELLRVWNKKFNLTRIIEENDVYLKHFYDSICLVKSNLIKNENMNICDLGSGAGLPGIVIKIFFDNVKMTLIESSTKKCEFLRVVIKELNLKDVEVINERGETYAKNNREKFDIVTCRAVSALNVISEISIPLLKINGYFLPLKSDVEAELKNSKHILSELYSIVEKVISYELPKEFSKRSIIVIKKLKEANKKYPREYKDIIKHLK